MRVKMCILSTAAMFALALGCKPAPTPPPPVEPDVQISLTDLSVSGNFVQPVAADPWEIQYNVVIQNDTGRTVTLNHLASRVTFQPGLTTALRTYIEPRTMTITAGTGRTVHTIRKDTMIPIPSQARCGNPVTVDLAVFSVEGTAQILSAPASASTTASCVF